MASVGRQACYWVLCLLFLLSLGLNTRIFLSTGTLLPAPTFLDPKEWILNNALLDKATVDQLPSSSDLRESEPARTTKDDTRKLKVRPLVWKDGCQDWEDVGFQPQHVDDSSASTNTPPTGIAVTLAKRKNNRGKDLLGLLCQKVPTQQAYFYEPQGIDLLMLIEIEDVTHQQVAECLELQAISAEPFQWHNLDGSILKTYEYRSKTGRGKVFLAPFEMQYPDYIQQNKSLLTEKMEGCDRGTDFEDYVQGTRYYSNDVLHLSILRDYDYLLKVDLDIEFKQDQIFPFHLLHDMSLRGAIFGHSGEFLPKGFGGCTKNINEVVDSFVRMVSTANVSSEADAKPSWSRQAIWKAPCSAGVDAFERGKDQYYTNLVVMRVDFFQSEHVRAYGKWMNEYYPGFFRYGWTDQLFFHKAMGLFLGPE